MARLPSGFARGINGDHAAPPERHAGLKVDTKAENRPLTALRGLAASWVFVSHVAVQYYTSLPRGLADGMMCGWLGVDIFFVLSGFIIATVYADLVPSGWARFWTRRIFRVFPLNLVVVGGLALLAAAGLTTGASVDWPNLPWHLLMLQSFVPGHKPGWIFVNWSVGIELICYVFFPFLVLLFRWLGTLVLVPLVALLFAATWWAQMHALGQFFGAPAILRCSSEFLLGAGLGTLTLRLPRLAPGSATVLEMGGLALLVFAATGGFGHQWCEAPASWRMSLAPLAAAVVIFALASDIGRGAAVLRTSVPLWIGRVSFSIYLLHTVVLGGTAIFFWSLQGRSADIGEVFERGAADFVLVCGAAYLTYRFVETPGRRIGAVIYDAAARSLRRSLSHVRSDRIQRAMVGRQK